MRLFSPRFSGTLAAYALIGFAQVTLSGCALVFRGAANALKINTNPATALSLLGGRLNLPQGVCTGAMTLARLDSLGMQTGPASTDTVTLGGVGSGAFYLSSDCTGSTITTASISAGQYSVNISYRNNTIATANLTATSGVLTAAGATVTTIATLAPLVPYANGSSGESWIDSGDVDGDGIIDIITTNAVDNQVNFYKGNSDGTFQARVPTALAGSAPRAPTVADVDGDGDLDVVVVFWSSAILSVLFNNGSAVFTEQTYPFASNAMTSVVADFDQDGFPDIVATQVASSRVRIFWGNGLAPASNFASTTQVIVGSNPLRVMKADIDGDGDIDLVVPNSASDTVSLLTNNGSRSFAVTTPITYAGGTQPSDGDFADINGDGKLDLVISHRLLSLIGVHLGNGDGTFGPATTYATGSTPNSLHFVDFNRDGILDIVNLCTNAGQPLRIWFGTGTGTFVTPAVTVASIGQPMQSTIGDFDGDGAPDIAATPFTGSANLSVFINNF